VTVTEQERPQLPMGWAETRIGDICDLINGRAFKPTEWVSAGIPIIRIQNLNDPTAEFNYCDFEVEEKYLVDNGQLLFAWSGTPGTSFGAHLWNRGKAVLNQHIFKVNINEKYLDKNFLKHLFNRNVKEYIGKAHGTAGLAHITKGKFEDSKILIPPFYEQRRIVSKVEELFSFLDTGTESLRKVQAQLKRYRQAVLKYAFDGKLTEEWRRTHKDHVESAQNALEMARLQFSKKPKTQISFEVTSKITFLPDGWVHAKLENFIYIAGRIGWRGLKADEYTQDGPLFLSVYNLNKGNIVDISETYHISDERYSESPEIQLRNDDILLAKDGAGIGKIGIVQGLTVKATVNSSLLVIRSGCAFKPKFLFYFFKGPRMQELVKSRITGSATPHLFQRDIRKFNLLIPPLLEQEQIIAEIESRLSVADQVENIGRTSIKQANHLHQAILKNAFEGKLVPQDSSEQPAEKLLECIKAERLSSKKSNSVNQLELSHYVK